MAQIVIIDDESKVLELMSQLCRTMGHEPHPYQTGKEGFKALGQIRPELVIVDLRIGDMNGMQIIQRCRQEYPDISIIMVTGYGTVETAVEAMRLGAFDYLTKPFELADLQRTIARALETEVPSNTSSSETPARPAVEPLPDSLSIIGKSPELHSILDLVEKIADNDSPALLEGEFGSGKRMVARTIHNRSRRNPRPFKILHCSALPEDLLEAELFGSSYGKGKTGGPETIFSRAAGGTVLLEEVNVLPLRLQSQLDSYLEDINARRLRGTLPPEEDFRFIASSNEPLEKLVKSGEFREDFYYRISVIPINIPPLRKRKEDIPVLVDHFLDNYANLTQSPKKEMEKYATQLLTNYSWPGNVGELQNAIERACAFSEGKKVTPDNLPPKITNKVEVEDEETNQKQELPIGTKLSEYIKRQEQMFIQETLKYNSGSREKTASMLGVSIATLYRKMGMKMDKPQRDTGAALTN